MVIHFLKPSHLQLVIVAVLQLMHSAKENDF